MRSNRARPKKAKILVAGHFAAGKTTFLRTLTESLLDTEKKIKHEEEKKVKETTTVAMDFTELITDDGTKLHIFGIPGQERFSFMWPILAKNTAGIIYVLDSTDEKYWYQLFQQINMFRKISPDAVFIFAANKQDLPDALSVEEIRKKMKLPDWVKVVPLVALDRESVMNAIKTLLEEIERKRAAAGTA